MSKIELTPDYDPQNDKEFMSPLMLAYFREKLVDWKNELLRESSETLNEMQDGEGMQEPDLADRASAETDHFHILRTRDRERKLIGKIDSAIKRIDAGDYGYCEETGEPISVERLKARPIATLSIAAQEMHEKKEKVYRDD